MSHACIAPLLNIPAARMTETKNELKKTQTVLRSKSLHRSSASCQVPFFNNKK